MLLIIQTELWGYKKLEGQSAPSVRKHVTNISFQSCWVVMDDRSFLPSTGKKKQPTDRLKLPKLKAQTKLRILSLVVQICTELVVWPFSSLKRSPLKAPENKLKTKLKERTMTPPNPVGILHRLNLQSQGVKLVLIQQQKNHSPFQIPQINDFAPPGPWKDTPNFPKTPPKKEIPS